MYFSATSIQDQSKHCIGSATSPSADGPFVPQPSPIACPLNAENQVIGAIDPSGFIDADSKVYVVYKIDGNSQGGGGPCGNENGTYATPLMLQEVSATDGYTLIGAPLEILDRSAADGPLIEAPSLFRSASGVYFVFFSSNCYNGPFYDVKYASSTAGLKGPYTEFKKPLLQTGDYALNSPGGATVLEDGSRIYFHADQTPSDCDVRQMYSSEIEVVGTEIIIVSSPRSGV